MVCGWPGTLLATFTEAILFSGEPASTLGEEGSQRLGLVTLQQMSNALVAAVESPATGIKTLEVPAIRNIKLHAANYPSQE